MRSRWSDEEAAGFVARYGPEWGEGLALRTYSSRLLGVEPGLVLHGGGNSSVKLPWRNVLGEEIPAIFVKASGADMATIEPAGHCGLDLGYLRRLRTLSSLDDEEMVDQLRTHLLRADGPTPSIESLVHAFLPGTYIDHTHADAVLALTNREDGEARVRRALGEEVIVLPYLTPGFKLALAASEALEAQPGARGMVWAHHGIATWGESAREAYDTMIELVSRAEKAGAGSRTRPGAPPQAARPPVAVQTEAEARQDDRQDERLARVAPVLRGLLAARTGDPDRPYRRVVLSVLTGPEICAALSAPGAQKAFVSPPLTTDHLIRTKALPLWVDGLPHDDPEALRAGLAAAVAEYCDAYQAYLARHAALLPAGVEPFDPQPRVVMMPGLGVFCAGPDVDEALITHDITEHTLAVKAAVLADGGEYRGLPEEELFRMEYRTLQHAKLGRFVRGPAACGAAAALGGTASVKVGAVSGAAADAPLEGAAGAVAARNAAGRGGPGAAGAVGLGLRPGPTPAAPLRGQVALVTGAAGAIGTGICRGLLAAGCLVAATDLAGEPLDTLVRTLEAGFPGRIAGIPLDVTEPESVKTAFDSVAGRWGGVDLVIPNAGVAAVAPLTDLTLDRYRKLEQVNVEGTLLVLAEAARLFRRQGTGGDIVVVSTKNVFAPGASFGAYSSTKAAAHQLARVAALEFAGDDVRVNMVAPDAVFTCGDRRSGLWAEVGPDRMRARGLDEAGLEAYYQSRNLLKARVTAEHVANAVLYFATRQTPTTGATIPVDGGLPDATPR
ncbi:MAG: bifunctional aldolase/short-chain dehydrogenase [Actinomycetia bacterium]|nr:bifunctional aldolase/short-chain dehydrogenase [Actinomycetes bacterium]